VNRNDTKSLDVCGAFASRHTRLHSMVKEQGRNAVLFLCNEAGPTALWYHDLAGGQSEPLTGAEYDVQRYWTVDDSYARLIFASDRAGNEREQLLILGHDGTISPLAEDANAHHYFGGQVFNGIGYYISNNLYETSHRIMRADLAAGTVSQLFAADAAYTSMIALSSSRLLLIEEYTNIDRRFGLFDIDSGVLNTLEVGQGRIRRVVPLSTGSVLFAGDLGGERIGVHKLDADQNEVRPVFSVSGRDVQDFDLHPATGRLAVTVGAECTSEVVITSLDSLESLQNIRLEPSHVHSLCFTDDLQLLTVCSSPFSPPKAQLLSLDQQTEMSSPPIVKRGNLIERVERFRSFDQREIEYVVMGRPDDRQAIIYLHGGPEDQFQRSHSPILERIVSAGLTVVAPNIRGSEGYGRTFISLDDGMRRLDALADVVALHSHMHSRLQLDENGIGIMGHSYGGFMSLMAISHFPELWQCAIDIAGMSHLGTFLRTAPVWRRKLRALEYGDADQLTDFFDKIAPLHRAQDITCPLLILHGDSDVRVPTAESSAMAQALTAQEKSFVHRWIIDEGHFLTRRQSTEFAADTIEAFIKEKMLFRANDTNALSAAQGVQ